MPRLANHRSTANTVMPIEPKGTRPISTLWPDRRSQSSEPTPMPIENTASSSVTTPWSPPSVSLAKPAKVVRKIEPKNHSQEMPRIDRNTERLPRAWPTLRQVSVNGFQLIVRPGSGAGDARDEARGNAPDQRKRDRGARHPVRPDTGHADQDAAQDGAQQNGDEGTHLHQAVAADQLGVVAGAAAGTRTSPGPNSVECRPIRNTPANSRATTCQTKPAPITSMMAISRFLMKRINAALSYLSASWPAVAENSTKGRMKTPPITAPADFGSRPPHSAAL